MFLFQAMLFGISLYSCKAHCITDLTDLVVMHHSTVNKSTSVTTSTLHTWKNNKEKMLL